MITGRVIFSLLTAAVATLPNFNQNINGFMMGHFPGKGRPGSGGIPSYMNQITNFYRKNDRKNFRNLKHRIKVANDLR